MAKTEVEIPMLPSDLTWENAVLKAQAMAELTGNHYAVRREDGQWRINLVLGG